MLNDCVDNYGFFVIDSQENFNYSGSLGLAPYSKNFNASEGPSYVKALFD